MVTRKNERNTENLVRQALTRLGYYDEGATTAVEEQKSAISAVTMLLRAASKTGKGGGGSPEFIISGSENRDFLVLCECKAAPKDHMSPAALAALDGKPVVETDDEHAKRIQRFAADGVLHYAAALSAEYNVIAIAASGETKSALKVGTFLYARGSERPQWLTSKHGATIDKLLRWQDYVEHATFDPTIQRLRSDELMAFARELHDFMRDHAKLTESEKPLLVSGTLIALRNAAFAKSFNEYAPDDLQQEWLKVITKEIDKADIPRAKKQSMVQPYSTIAVHHVLGQATKAYPKGVLNELITRLYDKVWPFIFAHHDFDVVGQFYGEFLKYTGGDKKALGIVLTPRHVTELFAMLANVNPESRCLDICAGTGGFLISAMTQMLRLAKTAAEEQAIKAHGLIGVEEQPNMYALAASNMILRGDGKANLYQGSCFNGAIEKAVRAHKANVGFLNPPFSQRDADFHEMTFVKQMLDCLNPGGTGVAIVPMSCAISPHQTRVEILKYHTLEAVMSMPEDLFYPVGTITCIMVFTAHRPHAESDRKTWFGYWRNDGFVKTKHRGRIDQNGTWPATRDRWVERFRNREVHKDESLLRRVTASDEWCAEAYMTTDYAKITQADFERVVRNYAIFRLTRDAKQNGDSDGADATT